jgi:hypothetical protein
MGQAIYVDHGLQWAQTFFSSGEDPPHTWYHVGEWSCWYIISPVFISQASCYHNATCYHGTTPEQNSIMQIVDYSCSSHCHLPVRKDLFRVRDATRNSSPNPCGSVSVLCDYRFHRLAMYRRSGLHSSAYYEEYLSWIGTTTCIRRINISGPRGSLDMSPCIIGYAPLLTGIWISDPYVRINIMDITMLSTSTAPVISFYSPHRSVLFRSRPSAPVVGVVAPTLFGFRILCHHVDFWLWIFILCIMGVLRLLGDIQDTFHHRHISLYCTWNYWCWIVSVRSHQGIVFCLWSQPPSWRKPNIQELRITSLYGPKSIGS